MAIRDIIYLPDPRLRTPSKPVTTFDDALQRLIDDMFETLYHVNGVGLAAPQIGINLQLSVIDASRNQSEPLVLVNPKIVSSEGTTVYHEGCLSIPGAYEKVTRATKVTMQALDRHGKPYEMTADGLLGEAFQHEIDHLNGKLYIDLLSPLKRNLARKKLEKYKRYQSKKS